MVLVKADKESEAGVLPDEKLLVKMGKYNEDLGFSGTKRTVIDGPFTEAKELIAGFWLIQARSKEGAIERVKRAPNPFPGTDSEIEIRQLFEAADFGPKLKPELRQTEERVAAQMAKNAKR
jgi:hypothetical protein